MSMRQLNLGIEPYYDALLSDFVGEPWDVLHHAIGLLQASVLERLYIFGPSGSGKSHLLAAICEAYIAKGKSAIHVSLNDLKDAPADALQSLELFDLVVLDGLEYIAQHASWERAIFHLINRAQDGQGQLIFAANIQPQLLQLQLPDLVSRLAQSVIYQMPTLSPQNRRLIVDAVLLRRSWVLDDSILGELLQVGPQQLGQLMILLDQIVILQQGQRRKLSLSAIKALIVQTQVAFQTH